MIKFLKNSGVFILLLFAILSVFVAFTYSPEINFVSNSVSNNAKAKFIADFISKAEKSKIAIIGSSMSLNNINASKIEEQTGINCFNYSSWGMKIDNFQHHNLLKSKKLILMNLFFTDIGSPSIVPEKGYPYTSNKLIEYYNILSNFNTYKNQTIEIKKYIGSKAYDDYSCLNFDPWGGVILDSAGFNIIDSRWNNDVFKTIDITKEKVDDFVNRLEKFKNTFPEPVLVISFSPPQNRFKNDERQAMVTYLSKRILKNCPKTYFYDNFTLNFDNNLYLDNCHFNSFGANQYTDILISNINDQLQKLN